jgi:tetratricopeptide (TPR) repeat protein
LADLNAAVDLFAAVDRVTSQRDYWQLYLARGCLQRRMGNLAEAEADFKLAIERASGPEEVASTKAELGHYDEALIDAPAGSIIRVQLLLHLRQYDRALEEATHLALPAMRHSRRGVALSELKRYDEAVAEFSQALDLAPDRVQDWWRRGWVASVQGRHHEARGDFEEAARRDEYDSLVMRRLAWFLATCPDVEYRDTARAVTLAEKAASIVPYDGVFWHTVGVARYRHGDYDEALRACQRAIEMRDLPYSPIGQLRVVTDYDRDAGFFLAMSLWQLGQKEKAREAYDAAVAWMHEHGPDDTQLARFQKEAADLLGVEAPSREAGEAPATPQPDN